MTGAFLLLYCVVTVSAFFSPSARTRTTSSLASSSSVSSNFVKYQGLGNDFILIDNTDAAIPHYTPQDAIKMCDRNFGIGADGIIFALPGQNGCDYTMRIYNSDGSEPQMCGNGIRCMALFLHEVVEQGRGGDAKSFKIWTNAGQIVPKLSPDGLILVDMGKPILAPASIPTLLGSGAAAGTLDGCAVNCQLSVPLDNEHTVSYSATAVSMGNPHCIIFVESLDEMDPSFATVGPMVERHAMFPQKVNAEFVQVLSRSHVRLKVWERGAGPTLACGTGACATVVAGVLAGKTERKCTVSLPGGDLLIEWQAEDEGGKIFMTGPAKKVFGGAYIR